MTQAPAPSVPVRSPAESASTDPSPFGDRLAQRVAERESQLVLGLDPDPNRLWPRALELAAGIEADGVTTSSPLADPGVRTALAVTAHCRLVIDAVAEHCVAAKLQVACFERLGAAGWGALADVAAHARARGLLVIADAKRGDIDVSAAAYGQAFFGVTDTPYGRVAGLGVDALTVNPLLGLDALMPLVRAARAVHGGLFVLVRTSNPGAADVQARRLDGGGDVSDQLASLVVQAGAEGVGTRGLADVGAVVGATAPRSLGHLRERMPEAVFLLPGVGAQGGRVEDLRAAFAPGPGGGLVSVSRGLVYADAGASARSDPAVAARAEAQRLRSLAWQIAA